MPKPGAHPQPPAPAGKPTCRSLSPPDSLTITPSDDAGFVTDLYAAGALLVLDAEQAGGCSGLPLKRLAQL